LTDLPVERLQRGAYQPRREFEAEALESLASSIKAQGVLQPIVARPLDGRPLRNSSLASVVGGLPSWRVLIAYPVVVKDCFDEAAIAIGLIENIQREDLNPVEEGLGLKRLQDEFGLKSGASRLAVGRSRSAVANLSGC
jgi:ParB family chromosome partitioning protein